MCGETNSSSSSSSSAGDQDDEGIDGAVDVGGDGVVVDGSDDLSVIGDQSSSVLGGVRSRLEALLPTLQSARGFYADLPDTVCAASQEDSNCWNGQRIGE